MRNALELLQQKELDLVRIRKETEALRIVAPLLRDDDDQLAYTEEENGERFDLQCTGTDGFPSTARRVFAASEWEVSCGQSFLVPKPTIPDSNFWLWLSEKKQTVLASMHGPARRWWYGAAGATLVLVAIGGYEFGHRGHRAPVTNSSARASEVSPLQVTSSTESISGQTPIEPSAQRPNEDPSKPREADAPARREAHPDATQAPADSKSPLAQTASDTGGAELIMGRRYLQGEGLAQDHEEAARWLWKSVAKQNSDAALLLSDLFARGDGVPKSCEQARILLTLAAEHSSKSSAQELLPSSKLCDKN